MPVTNKHNLPDALVRALEADTYSRGRAHASVTQLIDAPRIRMLRQINAKHIVTDVSDDLWAMVGKALHHVAQLGAGEHEIVEERLFANVNGWEISGAIDHQTTGRYITLTDYKFTSVYAYKMSARGMKHEWETQLNSYAWLLRKATGRRATKLKIVAFLRDWSRHMSDQPGYPKLPIIEVNIPVWPDEVQQQYITDRVEAHQAAEAAIDWGHELPECSPAEMWSKPAVYAVTKPGKKRAKLFDRRDEAEAFMNEHNGTMEIRGNERTRCVNNYCRVAPFCSQWQAHAER